MHAIRWTTTLAAVGLFAALPLAAQDKGSSPAVTLKTTKYAGLADAVVHNRGKVVLVDFWATW